jgi:hypothetical protein
MGTKMKTKKYTPSEQLKKSNNKNSKSKTTSRPIHYPSFSWLGTGSSINH